MHFVANSLTGLHCDQEDFARAEPCQTLLLPKQMDSMSLWLDPHACMMDINYSRDLSLSSEASNNLICSCNSDFPHNFHGYCLGCYWGFCAYLCNLDFPRFSQFYLCCIG